MIDMHPWWHIWAGNTLAVLAMCYGLIAWLAVRARGRAADEVAAELKPPVSVLKPLCGADPDLYECLRTCCEQAYPAFQIICGVIDEQDAAVPVVHRLQREFPRLDLQLIVDRRQHGSNRKVGNLINMLPHARHDYLVIADSDVRVPPNYLDVVIAPLLDPRVGIVTCPYRGQPRNSLLWSTLGALFINEWFIPSVRVAALTGSRAFAFGVTIAMRRESLLAIGGFAPIANQLADDYRLGQLTRQRGLRTVLSSIVVETSVNERSFADLIRHEVRWLRTIRAVRPMGYSLAGITFSLPVAALGALLASGTATTRIALAIAAIARFMLHFHGRRMLAALQQLWLLPLADTLGFALWCWGFVTRQVHWRHDRLWIARDGSVLPVPYQPTREFHVEDENPVSPPPVI